MTTENNNWDLADGNFALWLTGEAYQDIFPITDILKSTYNIFRKKQTLQLLNLCNIAFKLFQEKEKKRREGPQVEDQSIRFCLSEPEPGYYERIAKQRNDEIIADILSGNQQAINSLYEHEFPKIVKMVIHNSGDLDNAKDIFQDGLVTFIEKACRKELDLTCSIGTYLYSICRILWLKQLRKEEKNDSFYDEFSRIELDITFAGNDTMPDIFENVAIAIDSLGDPCKKLLECFYYQNLSWDAIAEQLGYSNASSARNQKYKCLEKIRKMINDSSKSDFRLHSQSQYP